MVTVWPGSLSTERRLQWLFNMALDEKRVDRRIEPRVKTEGMLNVTQRMGDQVAEGHLVDISTRGAYIATGAT